MLATEGYLGPRPVLTERECRGLLSRLPFDPAPLEWIKGRAATSRMVYEIATRRSVLDPVVAMLGQDVVLWGASIVTRGPGDVHSPHVDIETSDPSVRAVSVWIGLENTVRESAVWLLGRTHLFGESIQQVAHEARMRRGDFGQAEVMAWATERDPTVRLVELDMGDGDAVWFDGHLWHGSDNSTDRTRTALLLQFAVPQSKIRMPDLTVLDWPFRMIPEPRPPCLVVSGESHGDTNRLVPPPPPARSSLPAISTWIRELSLPLDQDPVHGFRPHPIFTGSTTNAGMLSNHASILDGGRSPHDPHTHEEEEILLVLDGHGEIVTGSEVVQVRPGMFSYYPAYWPHTIRGVGTDPIQYLMFKWSGVPRSGSDAIGAAVHDLAGLVTVGDGGFRHVGVLDGPTAYLDRLECHFSELDAGAGYEPHVDAHDVAIVLLEGVVETLGSRVTAPAVVFTSGGWHHGIRNVGDGTARYLVFEFHGPGPRLEIAAAATGADPAPLPAPGTPAAAPDVPDGRPSVARRTRVLVWSAAGRLLKPFPKAKRAVRRAFRWLSPWR